MISQLKNVDELLLCDMHMPAHEHIVGSVIVNRIVDITTIFSESCREIGLFVIPEGFTRWLMRAWKRQEPRLPRTDGLM